MNKVEQLAHDLRYRGAGVPVLNSVLTNPPLSTAFNAGRWAVRQRYEYFGPRGRYDWQASTGRLADEAVKRGAMQKPAELKGLLDVLQRLRPARLLEIGTARGGLFFALAHIATADAALVSIDLPRGEFGGGYGRRGRERLSSYALASQNVVLLRADSHLDTTREAVETALDGEQLDFLMIDGDHTKVGALADFYGYSPLVRSGGLVALHDVTPNPTAPRVQVPAAWEILADGHRHAKIVDPPLPDGRGAWGGIGLVQMP